MTDTNNSSNRAFMANDGGRPSKRDLLKKRRTGGPQPPSSGKSGGKSGWPLGHRISFIVLLVILGFFMWKQMNSERTNYGQVTYTKFDEMIAEGLIVSAEIRNQTFHGKFKTPQSLEIDGEKKTYQGIEVEIGDYDRTFLKELIESGIDLKIMPEKTWMNLLVSTLPWILIFGIWLFFLRQMQGGQKGVFTFGKSRAKLMAENQPKVTFDDVAGVQEAKTELEEIIEFLKDPRRFQRLGGKIPKGALLVGPPGTGKTLLARAVAGEAGAPFFSMSGSDFVEMFVGVGASRVRDLFEQGKTNAPCIIFIDEIDAVGRQRGAGIGGGHDEREQTLNQLLVEMDGFESNEGVILIAATNRPDVLDPALLRPGRFDRQIVVDWPDVKAREQILRVHAKKVQTAKVIDLESVAKGTPGMTGADLANVVNEAALLAARLNKNEVTQADFEEARDKVMMGAERKSMVINEDEKKLTAYHEAGHVLAAKYSLHSDPVHKVSIIARGRALGQTQFLPSDNKHNWSYNYCIGVLTRLLGGRAAEMIKFGDITNGASNDIENATKIARKMTCEWGMSKRLGPLSFGQKDQEVFLGREIATHKDYSEETAIAIDQEVRRLVETAQQQAESIIREHIDQLEALSEKLLKNEVLSANEIDEILQGKGSQKRRPSRRRRRPSRSKNTRTQNADTQNDSINSNDQNAGKKTDDTDTQKPVVKPEKKNGENKDSKSSSGENTNKPRSSRSRRKPGSRRSSAKSDESKAPEVKSDATNNTDKTPEQPKAAEQKNAGKSRRPSRPKSTKPSKSVKSSKGTKDKKDSKDGTKRLRRARLIRLKTGGRQRVIRKAPAKKIRKIN